MKSSRQFQTGPIGERLKISQVLHTCSQEFPTTEKYQLVPYLVEYSRAKLAQIHAELRINSYTCPAMDFFLNYRICLEVQLEATIIQT